MNFNNCIRIMKKDWKGTIHNKEIIIPLIILPIIFIIVFPILILYSILFAPDMYLESFGDKEVLMKLLRIPKFYNDYLIAAVIMSKIIILPYYLFIPAFISIIISSDSFAGEKERKTIESIALLPITKKELIIGKVLTAFLPALILSFICFLILGIEINIMFLSHLEGNILIFTDLTWLFTVFVLGPVMAFFNILVGVIISSRSKSFKNAQSITGSLVIPVFFFMFIQIFNPAFLAPLMILIISGIFGLFCIILIQLGKHLLNIEKLILMI